MGADASAHARMQRALDRGSLVLFALVLWLVAPLPGQSVAARLLWLLTLVTIVLFLTEGDPFAE